eukprot:5928691-Pleurochrysis_carterae.AAC.1
MGMDDCNAQSACATKKSKRACSWWGQDARAFLCGCVREGVRACSRLLRSDQVRILVSHARQRACMTALRGCVHAFMRAGTPGSVCSQLRACRYRHACLCA